MSSSMTVNILQQSIDLVERYANLISKDLKGDSRTETLNDLASYVLYFSKAIECHEASGNIFKEIVDEVNSAPNELNFNDVLTQFNERIENVQQRMMDGQETEKYIDFKRLFSEQDSKIDDDITTVCQNLNTIDPISKLPITEPVRNRKCGHVYEKRTILELIQFNPRTKCPMVGCSAVEFIRKSDIVPDTAMKRVISQSAGNSPKKAKLDE